MPTFFRAGGWSTIPWNTGTLHFLEVHSVALVFIAHIDTLNTRKIHILISSIPFTSSLKQLISYWCPTMLTLKLGLDRRWSWKDSVNLENYHIELDMESLWRNDHRGIEKDGISGCTIRQEPGAGFWRWWWGLSHWHHQQRRLLAELAAGACGKAVKDKANLQGKNCELVLDVVKQRDLVKESGIMTWTNGFSGKLLNWLIRSSAQGRSQNRHDGRLTWVYIYNRFDLISGNKL